MSKKSQSNPAAVDTLPRPIAQPVWDSACAHHRAQVEYDHLTRELDRAATVLRVTHENLSSALKNYGIGSVAIDMNVTDRLVRVFDESRGQYSFLLLKGLPSEATND